VDREIQFFLNELNQSRRYIFYAVFEMNKCQAYVDGYILGQ